MYCAKRISTKASALLTIAVCLLLLSAPINSHAQKEDYVWLSGYQSDVGFDSSTNTLYGTSVLDFNYTPRNIYYDSLQMNFDKTNTSYCDANGNLLFYTNGIYVANSLDEKIENSDSLNWGEVLMSINPNIYKFGYPSFQGVLALPKPMTNKSYVIVTTFYDTISGGGIDVTKVLYHVLDMESNNGMGEMILKNQEVLTAELSNEMGAVKHGDGVSWWILLRQQKTNCYITLLLSSIGLIKTNAENCLGAIYPDGDVGSFAVAPDGAKIAHYCPRNGVQIFDFDRCEGLLSNVITIPTPGIFDSVGWFGGLCFSPSGRFLYVGATLYVFQYDTWAADIAGSVDTVAVYNGSQNPFGSYFITMQMGPDGKIYESCGNGEKVYHVIERPDEKGDSCLFRQSYIQLPTFSGGVPNFPNYRLGALAGSPCDTITSSPQTPEGGLESQLKVFPNPASKYVVIDYGFTDWGKGAVRLDISNEQGQVVYQQALPMYSGFQKVDVSGFAAGGYFVSILRNGSAVAKSKFIKQ